MGSSASAQLELGRVFTGSVLRYVAQVLPLVGRDLGRRRVAASEIPDRHLRRIAGEALAKRGNVEGAALFATLAPNPSRRSALRALVCFQTAYNYLDALSELPSDDPLANGKQLHLALLGALRPHAEHQDYYAHNPHREDGGYLVGLLDECRGSLMELPAFAALAPTIRDAAARIVAFQALNLSEAQGSHEGLRRWSTELTPPGSGLAWWETAGGAGSSLAVYALIAAAADPDMDPSLAREIDRAYFPWIGALHSLLDSLVDRREDSESGCRSLLDYYGSPAGAETHLAALAARARLAVERLPRSPVHMVILTAMCSYYLSAPECDAVEARAVTGALTSELGSSLSAAIALFRSRRLLRTLTNRSYT